MHLRRYLATSATLAVLIGGLLIGPVVAATPAEVAADKGGIELQRGNFAAAASLLTEALGGELANERKANVLNDRGVAQWRLGKLKAALTDFNDAVQIYPEFAAIYNNRATVLLSLNEPEEALKDLDRALLLAPSYVAAINNRAIANLALGKHSEAIADFNHAAQLQPTSPTAFNGRGRVQLALNRPYAAIRDFTQAIALDPQFRLAYRNRAGVFADLARAQQGLDDLTSALSFAGDDPALLLARGEALIRLKDYGGAIRDLSRVVELDPRSAAALADRGMAYAHVKEFEKAMADFTAALDIDKRTITAYVNRAFTHRQMGASELGLADIERALKLDPQNGPAFRIRAGLAEALQRNEQAVQDYRQAVAIDPDDAEAWAALERLAGEPKPAAQLVAASQIEDWDVYSSSGGRFFAINSKFNKLEVPLEMYGEGEPELLDWEVRKTPLKGIGVLRYRAGRTAENGKSSEIEYAVIVDLYRGSIVGIEPYRIGERLAAWTWGDDGRVVVKGADGVVSDLTLREGKRVAERRNRVARNNDDRQPFDFLFGNNRSGEKQARQQQRPAKTKKQRPTRQRQKSLFELLFQ